VTPSFVAMETQAEVAAAVLALWRGLLQQRLLGPAAVSATTFTTTVSWMLQGAPAAHRR